jgi:hypothetical protein
MIMARRVCLFTLVLIVVGYGFGYALGYTTLGYGLMHIGGLGSLGLLASGVGYIAHRKGYRYWPAFSFALSSSILIGTIGAYLVTPVGDEGRPAACGGSLSLVIALVFLVVWAIKKRRVEAVS